MTLTDVIMFLVAIVGLFAVCVWYANRIEAEPPTTAAERDFWPADVVEDNGEYDD